MTFPIFKTKIKKLTKTFDLNNPKERGEYFELKAGREIKKLKNYLKRKTFIAYLLGKKNSGKGTYAKMFAEVVDSKEIEHFSVGDMIREVDKELKNKKEKKELIKFLEKNYRGWLSVKELILTLEKRSVEALLPTELILTLIKREIEKRKKKKTLFVDGFPRNLDQISYSLFFRDLIGYSEIPDIFVLIDVPEAVIDARMRSRRVCPLCQTSRNLRLLPTSKVGYEEKNKEFYLICDNPSCRGAKMVSKEGDELGISSIMTRLKLDEELMKKTLSLCGIPKILLRNSVPVKLAKRYVDDYEITPEYIYQWQESEKKVKIEQKPWIISDDEGVPSYSLLAPPVVVSLIKQLAKILNL